MDVDKLIADLESADDTKRQRAAKEFQKCNDKRATLPLLSLLKDANSETRRVAAIALSHIATKDIIPQLLNLLMDLKDSSRLEERLDNYSRGIEIALVLGSIEDELLLNELIELLSSDEKVIRASAAGALSYYKSQKPLNPLIGLLNDGDAQVRAAAIGAIGSIGVESVDILLKNLEVEDDDEVLVVNISMLAQFDEPKVVQTLRNLITNETEYSYDVIWSAEEAIKEIEARGNGFVKFQTTS